MNIRATPLDGAYVVALDERRDARGFFARAFCQAEFAAAGLNPSCSQTNLCWNAVKGTIRGMHFQIPPHSECKLVRCVRGSVLDVIVDLRTESDTYMQHFAVELSSSNRLSLYVPPLFAHGYQVLEDDTELHYQMSDAYAPGSERGIRFDDQALGISWPLTVTAISAKDCSWPEFSAVERELRRVRQEQEA